MTPCNYPGSAALCEHEHVSTCQWSHGQALLHGAKNLYTATRYYGLKGFDAMCGGGQTERGGAIHIPLTIYKPTIIIDSVVQHFTHKSLLFLVQ